MKKTFLSVLIFGLGFFALDVLAQNFNNSNDLKSKVIAEVLIQEAKISEWTQDKSTYVINFDVVNNDNVRQSGIKYALELYYATKEQGRVLVDRKVFDETLQLEPNSSMHKIIRYNLPVSLDRNYDLELVLATENGVEFDKDVLGVVGKDFSDGIFIDSSSCYLQLGIKDFHLLKEVNLNDEYDQLKIKCEEVENVANDNLVFFPEFITKNETEFGKVIDDKILNQEILNSNEARGFSFVVPIVDDKKTHPVELSFINENGERVSNSVYFKYSFNNRIENIQNTNEHGMIDNENETVTTYNFTVIKNVIIFLVAGIIFVGAIIFVIKFAMKFTKKN